MLVLGILHVVISLFHSFFLTLADIKRIRGKGPQSWQTFLFKVIHGKKSIKMHMLCKVLQAANLKKSQTNLIIRQQLIILKMSRPCEVIIWKDMIIARLFTCRYFKPRLFLCVSLREKFHVFSVDGWKLSDYIPRHYVAYQTKS